MELYFYSMGYLKIVAELLRHRFRQMYAYFSLPEKMFEAEVSVDDTRKQSNKAPEREREYGCADLCKASSENSQHRLPQQFLTYFYSFQNIRVLPCSYPHSQP